MLAVLNLKVSYGGITAVKGVSFAIEQGEAVAFIGANGAGKTSLLKALARVLTEGTQGSVKLRGAEIAAIPPHHLIRHGLALVPEGRGVFARLSVAENLAMGAYTRDNKQEIVADLDRVYELLPQLKMRQRQLAGTLSGGEQQMLALGRALMARPQLLLLDEPSMGLAPMMVNKVFDTIRSVAASGVTIVLVEQNAKLALQTASRGYVMESGRITLADSATALLADPRVRQAYLGE